jgi:hypothetical protein
MPHNARVDSLALMVCALTALPMLSVSLKDSSSANTASA